MKLFVMLFIGVIFSCSPKIVIEERLYGLQECVLEEQNKIINIDTISFGDGKLKRVFIER